MIWSTYHKPMHTHLLQENVPLADHTTLGLGGPARYLVTAQSVDQIRECLTLARRERLPVQVLGGGSNIVFPDAGFPGLVLKVGLPGVAFEGDTVTAGAGEVWDDLVATCVERGLAGIECLSGIPGLVGATPIQNVGAYGQEVSDTLVSLRALDRESLEPVEFAGAECRFGYRRSRFKLADRDRYIVTQVTFHLRSGGRPNIQYPELQHYLQERVNLDEMESGRPVLSAVRQAVLTLRRGKSMLVDPADPHSRSAGSFFVNPILSGRELMRLQAEWTQIPVFRTPEGLKVPAAWLVERAGFPKGTRRGGVGLSAHHALALVNYGGTARELLNLAGEIQQQVHATFGIHLELEPVIVKSQMSE